MGLLVSDDTVLLLLPAALAGCSFPYQEGCQPTQVHASLKWTSFENKADEPVMSYRLIHPSA
jgi:hypothetical protein